VTPYTHAYVTKTHRDKTHLESTNTYRNQKHKNFPPK